MGDPLAPSPHRISDVVLAFATGTFLALVLLAYLFLTEAHVSSGATSFFTIVCSWLAGFLAGLHLRSAPGRFLLLLVVGVAAYYVARLLVWQFPRNLYSLPALGLCAAASGLAAGNFFPYAQPRFPRVKHLLLHENNGFILGLALALCGSVLAGGWLLDFAPVVGLLPVAAALFYLRCTANKAPSRSVEVVTAPLLVASDHMFPLFVSGLHSGILLNSLFLTVQVFVSASSVAFLIAGVAWALGILLNMKLAAPRALSASMGISIISYYVLLMVTSVFTPYAFLFPVLAIFILLAALPAGAFFREYAPRFSSASTLLHQNNGFVIGYVLSVFGFAEWGVNFLYWAPLLSYATAFLGQSRRSFAAYTCMLIVAYLCIEMDSPETFWTLVAAATVGGACFFWRHATSLSLSHSGSGGAGIRTASAGIRTATAGSAVDQLPAWAGKTVLFLAGLNLAQLYYFVSRDFAPLLGPGELSFLLVTAAFLAGLSVGYGASRVLPLALVKVLAPMALFAHLVLAVFTRVIAGAMISRGLGVEVLLGLLAVTALSTSAFFSLVVPKLADHMESGSLISAYGWKLTGIVTGIAGLAVLLEWLPAMLWPSYFVTMLILVLIFLRRTGWMVPSLVVGAFTIGLFTHHQVDLVRRAAEDYYAWRGYESPRLIFHGGSFHHSLEVIETYPEGDLETPLSRVEFLDGVESFRSEAAPQPLPAAGELSYFLSELPARYVFARKGEKLRVLILGGGPSDCAFRIRDYASRTTVVESDRLVVRSAEAHWSHITRYGEMPDLEVVVDDPHHYLKTVPERFDLIINHTGPLNDLGATLLHSREFYELIRSRLGAGGVFVESTRGRPIPASHESLAMRILRGVADAFPRYLLIEADGSISGRDGGYIYASDSLDLAPEELTRLLEADGRHAGTTTHPPGCDHFHLHKVAPLSWSSMDALLASSSWMEHGFGADATEAGPERNGAMPDSPRPRAFFGSLVEDSRLVQAMVAKAGDRRLVILIAAVLAVATAAKILASWSGRRRTGPIFVIHSDRPRRRRRRRKDASQEKTAERV